tara:strand:- start:178 stop:867 length:690 start_codon:yes stop_codon:yes gene_type:complete
MATNPLLRFLRFLPLAALGVALAGSSAKAQTPAPKIDAPFLWKVEGASAPSYLFGTIHAGVHARELPVRVGSAIANSDLFIMETAPAKAMQNAGPMQPMDLDLAQHAHRNGSRVLTLETLQFQMDLLSKLGNPEEIAAVLGDASDSSEIREIADAYRTGDLEALVSATGPAEPEMQEILLDARNRRWVQKLAPVLSRGGAFVAVGAGHMAGPEGLLALLDARGFSVQRA